MAWVVYLSNRNEDYIEWEVLGTPDPLNKREDARVQNIGREIGRRQSKLDWLDPYFTFESDHPAPIQGFCYPDLDSPVEFQILPTNRAALTDITLFMASMIVTAPVRDAIEAIEPGVHKYLPVEIFMADGSRTEPRWLLNVCTRADTIAAEHCEDVQESWPPAYQVHYPGWSKYVTDLMPGKTKLAVHRDKVAGRAIWFEYKLGRAMMADELHDFIVDNGSRGMDWIKGPNPAREV